MAPVRTAVTIRDVARVAKVPPGTVSRALNVQTRALVNQETADRVMRAAEQLGYRPNPIARGLKTNRSYTIGVLIPDITNPLFPPILRGIEDRLDDAGYTSLIVNTDNDAERERSHLEAMRARQVDGFISATARLDPEPLPPGGRRGPALRVPPRWRGRGGHAARARHPQPRGRLGARGHRQRPARDQACGRARRRARAQAHRPCRRSAEHLHRESAPSGLSGGDARRRAAGLRPVRALQHVVQKPGVERTG